MARRASCERRRRWRASITRTSSRSTTSGPSGTGSSSPWTSSRGRPSATGSIIAAQQRALGPRHPRLILALGNLGIAELAERRIDDAISHGRRALDVAIHSLGPDHFWTGEIDEMLARGLALAGRPDEAAPLASQALAIAERTYGADADDLVLPLGTMGRVAFLQGRLGDAEAHYRRQLAIAERLSATARPVEALLGLARLDLRRGAARKAVTGAERAVRLAEANGAAAPDVADARFLLARAARILVLLGARPLHATHRLLQAFQE